MPKISVIVPVYNAEKYLHRCIASILAQTITDFELLPIDDGSTDSPGAICDRYAVQDSRVRVFHKENGGVSSARNIGLDNARGEWGAFVDSDDIFTNNALNIFEKHIDAELIITSHVVNVDGKFSECTISDRKKYILDKEIDDFICRNLNTNVIKTIWAKFFNNDIIGDLRFDKNISCGEDFLFMLSYLLRLKQIYLVDYSSYIYSCPDIDFHIKYQSSIEQSIYTLYKLFKAYKLLNLHLYNFECSLFYDYKSLCQKEIYKTPHLWYNNEKICRIYDEIKSHLGVLFRIKYRLMSYKIISKMLVYVRGCK